MRSGLPAAGGAWEGAALGGGAMMIRGAAPTLPRAGAAKHQAG